MHIKRGATATESMSALAWFSGRRRESRSQERDNAVGRAKRVKAPPLSVGTGTGPRIGIQKGLSYESPCRQTTREPLGEGVSPLPAVRVGSGLGWPFNGPS